MAACNGLAVTDKSYPICLKQGGIMEAIRKFSNTKSNKKYIFNAQAYLASVGVAKTVVEYRRSEKAYSQGDPAMDVMYIQKGSLKLSVVNPVGKEAVVAVLGP